MPKIRISLLSLAWLLVLTGAGLAQPYVPDPDVIGKIKGAYQPIALVGRIGHAQEHGGYYIKNNPKYGFGDKVILNQNFQVLGKLAKSGKTVTFSQGQPPGIPSLPRLH